jgi:hypothetical protein
MRSASLLSIPLAALLSSGPASAFATYDAPQLLAAFQAICLDHLGDADAQAAAARSSPWNFAPDDPAESGEAVYRSEFGLVGIVPATHFCALSSEMAPQVDLASFQRSLGASLGLPPGTPLEEPHSVYWLFTVGGNDDEYVLGLKVSAQSGRNLATLTIQKRDTLTR